MKSFIILILIVFIPFRESRANTSIIEASSFTLIASHLNEADEDTLVLFDVDDVLTAPMDPTLHYQYRKYIRKLIEPIVKQHSKDFTDKLWSTILMQQEIKLVDPNILTILASLKNKGIKVLALTRCRTGTFGTIPSMEAWRTETLKTRGIDFTYSFPLLPTKVFEASKGEEDGSFATYKDGIIFTNNLEKDEALAEFLNYANWKPKKIIFIDDLLSNLESVKEHCGKVGIQFTGIHFTAFMHEKVPPLNEARAKLQYEVLEKEGKWLEGKALDERLSVATVQAE